MYGLDVLEGRYELNETEVLIVTPRHFRVLFAGLSANLYNSGLLLLSGCCSSVGRATDS